MNKEIPSIFEVDEQLPPKEVNPLLVEIQALGDLELVRIILNKKNISAEQKIKIISAILG